jgi:hypothetical protein
VANNLTKKNKKPGGLVQTDRTTELYTKLKKNKPKKEL